MTKNVYIGAMLLVKLKKVEVTKIVYSCDNWHSSTDFKPTAKFCSVCGGGILQREFTETAYPSRNDVLPDEMNEIDLGSKSVFGMWLYSPYLESESDTYHFLSNDGSLVDSICPGDDTFTPFDFDKDEYIANFITNYSWLIDHIKAHLGVVSASVEFGILVYLEH